MTITAVIIVYNGEGFVADAIESILAQTRRPEEIIIIDDGSTDGTSEILSQYAGSVRIVRQSNGGEANARNRGLTEANGDLLAFLDADDLWAPEYVGEVVDRFEQRPELGMVFTAYHETRFDSDQWWTYADPLPDGWLRTHHFSSLWVTTPSKTVVRRELAAELHGFDELLPSCVDQDLYLRIGLREPFEYLRHPLVTMRRSGNNLSANVPRMWRASKAFYRKHRITFGNGLTGWVTWRRAKGTCRRVYARKLLKQGDRIRAAWAEIEAATIWPVQSLGRLVRFWGEWFLGDLPSRAKSILLGPGKEANA